MREAKPKRRAWQVLGDIHLPTLFLLYRSRLKAQPFQELLALLGIAAGVALLFAVQVANKSVTGSFEQLTRGIAGKASLEVAARGPEGFDQRLVRRIQGLKDVAQAAPVLERRIAVVGPRGRRPLTLVGVDERLDSLGGKLAKRFAEKSGDPSRFGLYLPAPVAAAVGVSAGDTLRIEASERALELPVANTYSVQDVGPIAQSPAAVAPLGLAQEIAAMPGRVTRVLVEPKPRAQAQAKAALLPLAAGRLNVRSSDSEAKLLSEAARPDRQSAVVFSGIGLVVGLLLAYNAMLLTVARRRQVMTHLRLVGADRSLVLACLLFDAVVLGIVASLAGVLLGDQLSRYMLHKVPSFLTSAFAIGSQRVVTPEIIAMSVAGGILATLAAAARPAIDLFAADPSEATHAEPPRPAKARSLVAKGGLVLGGLGLIGMTTALVVAFPAATVAGVPLVVLGMIMVLPSLVASLLAFLHRLARNRGSAIANICVAELAATPARATALAATGALAVFGILSLGGSSADLKRGIDRSVSDFLSTADLWVMPGPRENIFATQPFDHRRVAGRLERLPEVRSVRAYRGSFLDSDGRRLWIVGRPTADSLPIPPSQLLDGKLEVATRRIREGGWAALSATVANEQHLGIGEAITLPTPSGDRRLRLAAKITNLGWPSGTVVVNSSDYRLRWKRASASALEVDLADGIPASVGERAVKRAIGRNSGLGVQHASERQAAVSATTRQGLARLDQISTMVLMAAVLAVVAALLSSVWQRRARLAALRALGMYRGELLRAVLLETSVVLALGCVAGMVFGLYGQILASRFLSLSTGFPAPFHPALGVGLKAVVAAVVLALGASVIPTQLAVRVSPQASFSAE